MASKRNVIPPAKLLIVGLRNIGYNFSTALADIIDNSIAADAKNIKVISNPHAKSPYLVIFDDGYGMTKQELDNAMEIGSERSYKEFSATDLGRFGLGLKTASFSQCLRLTVVSKSSKSPNEINAERYDINEIRSQNAWVLYILNNSEIDDIPEIELLKNSDSGTIVVWEDFDTIRNESTPGTFVQSFIQTVDTASQHVAFVFHRFYDNVRIEFDGHRVDKRDPFLENSTKTDRSREKAINLDGEKIVVRAFVLPNTNSLTKEQKNLLGNPKNVSEDQGIYLYRNKRLISWGTWLRMNARSEMNKLARVRIDIPSSLETDSKWRIDVRKSSAKVPDKIKDDLQIFISEACRSSTREVSYKGRKEAEVKKPVWERVEMPDGTVKYTINREYPFLSKFEEDLTSEQRRMFDDYLKKVEQYFPLGRVRNDINSDIKIANSTPDDDEEAMIDDFVKLLNKNYHGSIELCDFLLEGQGYENLKSKRNEIVERLKDDTGIE